MQGALGVIQLEKRNISSQRGAAAIEFAFVAPVLFLFLMGIIEISLVTFVSAVMEGATDIGSRTGKVGYTSSPTLSREDYIRSQVDNLSAGLLNPANLNIQILSYANWNDIQYVNNQDVGKPEPCINPTTPPCPGVPGVNFVDINGNGVWDEDMGKADAGSAGQVVLYKVSYPWPIFTPMMQQYFGETYEINAVAAVQNEPFPSSVTP